jgi:CBS domain-containing protein
MNCLSIAHVPAIIVAPNATVLDAVAASLPAKIGAVAVVEAGILIGIFTERDVMLKVVHQRRDPATTLVREVMTSPVITIPAVMKDEEVLQLMTDKHIRHLPICEDGKTVLGILSIHNVLEYLLEDRTHDLKHMEAFLNADAPGG